MPQVLLALELGGNLGHDVRARSVGSALSAEGHVVSYAMPGVGKDPSFHTAPRPDRRIDTGAGVVSYAEVLLCSGYGSSPDLRVLLDGWRRILGEVRPDVAVVDHAPTALLACREAGVPTYSLSTGFTRPPVAHPMPAFPSTMREVSDRRLAKADDHVASVIRGAVSHRLADAIRSVSNVNANAPGVMATHPELDAYGPRDGIPYVGALQGRGMHPGTEWRRAGAPKVLAYARPGMGGLKTFLAEAAEASWETVVVIPGASAEMVRATEGSSVRIVDHPVDMPSMLREADAFVGYGGLGLVSDALMHGVPCVLLPQNDEQAMNSMCVERMGAGTRIRHDRLVPDLAASISEAVEGGTWKEAALRFAAANSERTPEKALAAIVAGIGTMLEKKAGTAAVPAAVPSP